MKSRVTIYVTHVMCMGRQEMHTGFFGGGGGLEEPERGRGMKRRAFFKWILKKYYGTV
jgi:hypothetical protein